MINTSFDEENIEHAQEFNGVFAKLLEITSRFSNKSDEKYAAFSRGYSYDIAKLICRYRYKFDDPKREKLTETEILEKIDKITTLSNAFISELKDMNVWVEKNIQNGYTEIPDLKGFCRTDMVSWRVFERINTEIILLKEACDIVRGNCPPPI